MKVGFFFQSLFIELMVHPHFCQQKNKKPSFLWHHETKIGRAIEDESGASFPALIRPSIFFTSMKTCHTLTSQFPPQKLWRAPWNNRNSHDSKRLKEKPTCFENCDIHFGKSIDSQYAWGIPTKTHPKWSFNQAPKIAAIWWIIELHQPPELSPKILIRFGFVMWWCLLKSNLLLVTKSTGDLLASTNWDVICINYTPTTLTWKCENQVSWISEDSGNLKTKQIIVRWLQRELTINSPSILLHPGETKQMTMEDHPQLGGVSPKKRII